MQVFFTFPRDFLWILWCLEDPTRQWPLTAAAVVKYEAFPEQVGTVSAAKGVAIISLAKGFFLTSVT